METRAVQAALGVEAEGRKAQEARAASLEEMERLSLVKAGAEKERDDVVSVILEGGFPNRAHDCLLYTSPSPRD